MFEYIIGNFIEFEDNKLIVENNDIAFLFNSLSSYKNLLKEKGKQIKIWTYMSVKEDDISLFGFLRREEKIIFLNLISVSGLGPKGVLSILSTYSFEEIISIIINKDSSKIVKVSGIGSKTAEKIIIELYDKIIKLKNKLSLDYDENLDILNDNNDVQNEVVNVLYSLGYQKKSAIGMVKSIPLNDNMTTEELLKLVLKK